MHNVLYWLQGEEEQNFGDFLSEYMLRHLFLPQAGEHRAIRIVGSCVGDAFVEAPGPSGDAPGPVFWSCGLRSADSLSPERQKHIDILAIRGPLSAEALGMDASVPLGDSGLLLPVLHPAPPARGGDGLSLVVPHFHDRRSDQELLALSGCDRVLRPNIPNDLGAIDSFIDTLLSAAFVLCGSLHAAITAAAYERPFAFWDSGDVAVDLPFKWRDFAALVKIPCAFLPDLATARRHWQDDIRPNLRIPALWPLLAAAPMPVRPDILVAVVKQDIARHGIEVLDLPPPVDAIDRVRDRLAGVAEKVSDDEARLEALAERHEALTRQVEALSEAVPRLEEALAGSEKQLRAAEEALRHEWRVEKERRTQFTRMDEQLVRLNARVVTLAEEEARLHAAVADRDRQIIERDAELRVRTAELEGILRSGSWRALRRLRRIAQGVPGLSPLLRLYGQRRRAPGTDETEAGTWKNGGP